MRKLCVIGIGAGDPDYVTVQAVKALNRVDVFFVVEKGPAKDDLVRLRRDICERYIEDPSSYRVVTVDDPERDRAAPSYAPAVEAWREQRMALYEQLIEHELGEDETGGFLVWGDPSLYDGTLVMLDAILRRGRVSFDHEVIPGISAVSALAARHRVALNRVGEAIQITTGRRLATAPAGDVANVVVMVDGESAFTKVAGDGVHIYWGAYLGTDDEILVSGPLHERGADIERIRSEAKSRKGWMFDTYLLRRNTVE
ncbi:MAG: precorrin-6A synthase (deacetylating) [Actinomycetota bacterium]